MTDDVKKIHQQVRNASISSGDLARIFNLKAPTSGRFYERLYSLIYYGLLEQKIRGLYALTETGKRIADPDSEEQRIAAYKEAIFHVPLWKELCSYPKLPARIWISIKKITRLTSDEAQEIEDKIRDWYSDDIAFIQDLSKDEQESASKGYSLEVDTEPMSQQLVTRKPDKTYEEIIDTQEINFGDMKWILPKSADIQTAWEEFNDHMKIYFKYNIDSKNQSASAKMQQADESAL